MRDFQEKVVVITGAATGIGFALARQFARRGARIVIAARRRDRLEQAAASLEQIAQHVRFLECDVTRRDQVERLADFTEDAFGGVDVLVNNAGVGPIPSTVIGAQQVDIQRVLDVNLFGAWNGVSVFGQRFIDRGQPAAIYTVGSENCFFNAVPEGAGYVASKHAVLAMMSALREEVPESIEVGLICPGLVQSELSPETAYGMDADRYAALVFAQIEAGEFYIVSHSYNIVRIRQRTSEIERAYAQAAPRYPGDDEYDVRTLGAEHGWYPGFPAHPTNGAP